MNSEDRQRLEAAMDIVIEEYLDNPSMIFLSSSEPKAILFDFERQLADKWHRPARCIVEGCNARSIRRSHSIGRASFLEPIAEAGHVITPFADSRSFQIEARRTGINISSVFPGFCRHHEAMFFPLEAQSDFSAKHHVFLQLYRTACREVFRMRTAKNWLQRQIEHFIGLRNERLFARLKSLLDNDLLARLIQEVAPKFTVECHLEKHMRGGIQRVSEALEQVETRHIPQLTNAIESGELDGVWAMGVDTVIPVALCGFGKINVNDNGTLVSFLVLVNVLPTRNGTQIVAFAGSEYDKYLYPYMAQRLTPFGVLNMVESWMIHGTDHWFIKPSVWTAIPERRRRCILDEISVQHLSLVDEARFSIFDELRQTLLLELPSETNPAPELVSLVARELTKLAHGR